MQNDQPALVILMRPLNTPLKRLGGLVLLLGIVLSFFGLFQLGWYHLFDDWVDAVFRHREFAIKEYWMSAWGAYFTVVGLLFSFAYDAIIARIMNWVIKG